MVARLHRHLGATNARTAFAAHVGNLATPHATLQMIDREAADARGVGQRHVTIGGTDGVGEFSRGDAEGVRGGGQL